MDAEFGHPRLAAIYDGLDPDRSDLLPYVAMAGEAGVERVLDVGCGTGTLAILLAGLDLDVTALDPALASLEVARGKPGAERVRWVHGYTRDLPPLAVDLVTMTGNAAQAIIDPGDWDSALGDIHAALRPGGRFVFESRSPTHLNTWLGRLTREDSYAITQLPGVGRVESWVEATEVTLPLVSFRWTWVFASYGERLTSESTLRFRGEEEIRDDLDRHGFDVLDVLEAPDRPGKELVFHAHRRGTA